MQFVADSKNPILTQELVRQGISLGMGNPFLPMLYYVKGEISDIKAMEQTLVSRQTLIKQVQVIINKRLVVQSELTEKVQGKISVSLSTFKGLFQNEAQKNQYI